VNNQLLLINVGTKESNVSLKYTIDHEVCHTIQLKPTDNITHSVGTKENWWDEGMAVWLGIKSTMKHFNITLAQIMDEFRRVGGHNWHTHWTSMNHNTFGPFINATYDRYMGSYFFIKFLNETYKFANETSGTRTLYNIHNRIQRYRKWRVLNATRDNGAPVTQPDTTVHYAATDVNATITVRPTGAALGRITIVNETEAMKIDLTSNTKMMITTIIYYQNGTNKVTTFQMYDHQLTITVSPKHVAKIQLITQNLDGTVNATVTTYVSPVEEEPSEYEGPSKEWLMFHNDNQRTGYSEDSVRWVDGYLVRWARDESLEPEVLWEVDLEDPVLSSPIVFQRWVFIGVGTHMLCLDAQTGEVIWNVTNPNPAGWIETTPMVFNHMGVPGDWRVCVGSYDRHVYCLNASTGAQLWNFTTDAAVRSSPAYLNGRLFVGSNDGHVYCLNASTGELIWSFPTGGAVLSSPTIHDGRVYIGSYDDHVYCLNATTGVQIWNVTTGDGVMSTGALADGRLFIGSHDTHVYCLNATTGAQLWNFTTDDYVMASPAVAHGRVFIGSIDNHVYCLNASTGALIWSYRTGDFVDSSCAVTDEYLFVGSYDGHVYCLNTTDGRHILNFTTDGSIYSSPAIANGIVYVGSTDGYLHAYGSLGFFWSVWNNTVEIESNSVLSAFTFDQPSMTLRVNATGDGGTDGVCSVTFPTALLGGPYWVFVDDVECNHVSQVTGPMESSYELTANGYTIITVMYTHSAHTITINGTTVIPEFPTMFATLLILTALTLSLLFTTRRGVRYRKT
jgi:outer membrane protein assembly factor BamB